MERVSRQVKVGGIVLGGGAPVVVQSMLNAPAKNVDENVRQAVELQQAGCGILRVSVPTIEDVRLVPALKKELEIPLVADIHFDYRIALACVEAGIDKIRINPGNIGGQDKVRAVARACKAVGVPIRVGVNGGSLEKEVLDESRGDIAVAMVQSALKHVDMLKQEDFEDIVISLKHSHVSVNIKAYRMLAALCDYPLHLGVTEAGTLRAGLVKNALGIGTLLMEGIGDTLRVSLTAPPVEEVRAGYDILRAADHPALGPEIISCPTCGRTNIEVAEIAAEVEAALQGSKKQLKVAVMGCVVNGLGEGKDADIGIAGGKDSAVLFVKGEKVKTLRGDIVAQLLKEIEKL